MKISNKNLFYHKTMFRFEFCKMIWFGDYATYGIIDTPEKALYQQLVIEMVIKDSP